VTRVERELRAAELRARSTQLLARVARAIEVELASGLAGPLACELGQHLERISAVPDRRADLDPHLVLRGPQRSLAPLPVSPEMGGAAALESAVVRAGLEALSGGTREQLALVHRLAVGRALAGSERLLVVINDPLGDTDEARQTRALELLQEFARQLQIVVLTCRPERYAGLAGVARFELA